MNDGPGDDSLTLRVAPLLNQAQRLFDQGNHDAASLKVIEHLRTHGDDPRGFALLGALALAGNALGQAEQFLNRATALGDQRFETRVTMATVLLHQDIYDEALEAFTALERDYPEDVHLTATRALILDKLGRHEEALEVHRKAIELAPTDSRYQITYGHSLRFAGRTEDAIAVYRAVVDADPERGEAWWALADIKSRVLSDADMERMQEALGYAVDPLNIVPMRKALGKGWHDRGDYERAFAEYRAANRIRADEVGYEPAELEGEVARFIEMTSKQPLPAPVDSPGQGTPIPIFLVSVPRSGSTLLEQILDQHPEIEARGELPHSRSLMRHALESYLRRGYLDVPRLVEIMPEQQKVALGQEYLRRAALHRRGDSRFFIDKMPSNWSDILFIRALLPQARFIEIRRDALDCCLSNHTHHFGIAHAASYDLRSQGRAYREYVRLMDHIQTSSPGAVAHVRYEELVHDPRRTLTTILDYLGLEWDERMLDFHQSTRNVRTPSAEQVRKPLNRSGIGTSAPYSPWLAELKQELGSLAESRPVSTVNSGNDPA